MGYEDLRKIVGPDANDSDPKVEKAFIIPFPPQCQTPSLFSRTTQLLAYGPETKYLGFLKEYWRPDTDVAGIEKEGGIYNILHNLDLNVPSIAPFEIGNDDQDRRCNSALVSVMPLRNYRMTLVAFGDSLINVKSPKQIVSVIGDAMNAHDKAYFGARILHGDISVGNIIMYGSGTSGILIDWDMGTKVDYEGFQAPRRFKRTGTWQFMSIARLQDPTYFYYIQDDCESAFYVLLWVALRYTKHSDRQSEDSEPGQICTQDLMRAFDETPPASGSRGNFIGGSGKRAFLSGGTRTKFDNCPQLDNLIRALRTRFACRYDKRYSDATRMALITGDWLVDTMRKYQKADGWPLDFDDNSVEQRRRFASYFMR